MLKYQKGIGGGPSGALPKSGGTMTGAINLGNQGNTNGFEFLRDLMLSGQLKKISMSSSGWGNAVDGTASLVISAEEVVSARTGATANSTCVAYINPALVAFNIANPGRLDWDKKLLLNFVLDYFGGTANTFGYVVIYESAAPAVGDAVDLTAKGIGIKLANLALSGITYDTQKDVAALSQSLVAQIDRSIQVVHRPGTNVEWFVDKVSAATSTREPSGQAGAATRFAVMIENGATAADQQFGLINPWIWQEG